jgi:hypothetical protein
MQRLWLRATSLRLALSPAMTLPLLLLRLHRLGGEALSTRERKRLEHAESTLRSVFGVAADHTPLFLFRLGRAAPMAARALRREYADVVTTPRA